MLYDQIGIFFVLSEKHIQALPHVEADLHNGLAIIISLNSHLGY